MKVKSEIILSVYPKVLMKKEIIWTQGGVQFAISLTPTPPPPPPPPPHTHTHTRTHTGQGEIIISIGFLIFMPWP